MTGRRMTRLVLALLPLMLGSVQAAAIKLRPQGENLQQAVEAAMAQLSTKDVPMTLDTTGGPTLTLGGVGVSNAPFNPDAISRVVSVNGERRIEFNPQSGVPLLDAVKQALLAELKLKEWTPVAAQQRFGGADLNGDGAINVADLAIFMANYGSSTASMGDLNQDRKVDDADWRLFNAQYTAALNSAPVVPTATPAPTPETPPASSQTPADQPAANPPSSTQPPATEPPTTAPPAEQPPAEQPSTPPPGAPNPPSSKP